MEYETHAWLMCQMHTTFPGCQGAPHSEHWAESHGAAPDFQATVPRPRAHCTSLHLTASGTVSSLNTGQDRGHLGVRDHFGLEEHGAERGSGCWSPTELFALHLVTWPVRVRRPPSALLWGLQVARFSSSEILSDTTFARVLFTPVGGTVTSVHLFVGAGRDGHT